ncbi:3-hydroxy-3-methylglutaryl-CoA reductase [Candidatus Roizmanbacteria bacterium CG_4_10_14_0_8_um_filter_33_9]|uniref:hydroxymethylglutaryl-CoA reductase (NADPH) n=1 Tax=Candidatus Roizmanbacteria bacterium CG_4_10_14_0_8_um_filter_33_9 TaxID=1974826 RepID=A0A2M7QKL2_9BACT|nr:MAG: 3-hydroxy-3-methylglutaryl-CoA reductase [Candidatus Roizmanbacteria bacterium CG_4_10_14_0_8_um_filter_33_9]
MRIHSFLTLLERRELIEKAIGKKLTIIGTNCMIEEKKIHCENTIGTVPIPLGIAGPLSIKTKTSLNLYYVPLATTEGALVASINRGCKAISLSKGAQVYTEKKGVTRGPVFITNSLKEAYSLKEWLLIHVKDLIKIAESTSSHLTYLNQKIQIVGSSVFVRFSFDTQDAMGMNMVTIAVSKIAGYIEEKTGVKCGSVAGNFDIDKKPAWLNFIEGRGISVWAQANISKKILKEVLKTNAEEIYVVWIHKCLIGSAISGSLGFNSHFANIVGAFYIATGQDAAHIVEGSMGMTTLEKNKDGSISISVYLPAIMMGIIGGGTKLQSQHEALSVVGAKNPEELASVLGGAVLAGELSLLASLAQGSLASAHKKLGR